MICKKCVNFVRIAAIKSDNESLEDPYFFLFACRDCGKLSIDPSRLKPKIRVQEKQVKENK